MPDAASFAVHPAVPAPPPVLADPRAAVDLQAYCARIGFDGELTPTLRTLRRLTALHAAAIPFEAIDVLLDRGVDLAPAAVDAKLIAARRGGYCFEQNGLFRRVLAAAGFEVDGLLARVLWMQPPGAAPTPRTHMVLRVTVDGEAWFADVGFGSSVPTAPLRLGIGEPQPTANDTYRVRATGGAMRVEMRLPDAWAPLYDIDPSPQQDIDFELANWFTSTHPTSHFRHRLTVTRSLPGICYALLENRFTARTADGEVEQRSLTADEIERTLAETFGLPVEASWRPVIERAAGRTP